jgi:hypothetical protein
MSKPVGDIPVWWRVRARKLDDNVQLRDCSGPQRRLARLRRQGGTLNGSVRSVVVLVNEGGPDGHGIADTTAETAPCS